MKKWEGKTEEKRLKCKARFERLVKEAGYEALDEYYTQRTVINMRCNKGHIYETTGNRFFNGHRCPTCFGIKAIKPIDRFNQLIKENGMIALDEYQAIHKPIRIQCKHGHVFTRQPKHFTGVCPKCRQNIAGRPKDTFLKSIAFSNYKLLSEYVNHNTKVQVQCRCGYRYSVKPIKFCNGRRCPVCARTGYNKQAQGFIYLVRWRSTKTTQEHSVLKFGITNSPDIWRRIRKQQKKTDYVPDLIDYRFFINGEVPPNLEYEIKKKFKTGVIDKRFFGDGYTETVEDTRRNERLIRKMIWSAKHVV
ncbi:hypothetical protein [Vibrio vulnificus]|uniref:hypothetical protein n=1 Tax=Vibrio vulnificus TaxID=672 RepID=UPI0032426E44